LNEDMEMTDLTDFADLLLEEPRSDWSFGWFIAKIENLLILLNYLPALTIFFHPSRARAHALDGR